MRLGVINPCGVGKQGLLTLPVSKANSNFACLMTGVLFIAPDPIETAFVTKARGKATPVNYSGFCNNRGRFYTWREGNKGGREDKIQAWFV